MSSEKRDAMAREIHKLQEETDNIYLDLVGEVNKSLTNQPIGSNLEEAVSRNLQDVRSQTGSLPTYHGREVVALAKDSLAALKEGNYQEAGLNALGVVGNTAAFFVAGAYQANREKMGQSVHNPKKESASINSDDISSTDENRSECSLM